MTGRNCDSKDRQWGIFTGGYLALLLSLVVATSFLPTDASAGGVGAYFEYQRGDQEIKFDFVKASFTNNRYGVGLVYDTNVARDELLNYRAGAGYVRSENTVGDQAHGAGFDLSAGFGVVRTSKLRLWAGPTLRVSVDLYENDFADVLDVGVGGGGRLGLNWHVNSRLSVSPSISYQYLYVREVVKDDFGKAKFNGTEQLLTARITWLFRGAADLF